MTQEQIAAARELVGRLDAALKAERLSAHVRVVDGHDGEPKLRIASSETGEARQRLSRVVSRVLHEQALPFMNVRN